MPMVTSRLQYLRDREPAREFQETVEIASPATGQEEENLAIEMSVELRKAIAYASHLDQLWGFGSCGATTSPTIDSLNGSLLILSVIVASVFRVEPSTELLSTWQVKVKRPLNKWNAG